MIFPPGSRLGSNEITGKLGEGGMGEVYRATDVRLKRHGSLILDRSSLISGPIPDPGSRFVIRDERSASGSAMSDQGSAISLEMLHQHEIVDGRVTPNKQNGAAAANRGTWAGRSPVDAISRSSVVPSTYSITMKSIPASDRMS